MSLLTQLGFTLSPPVAELEPTRGYSTQLSRERIELLEADALLFFSPSAEVQGSYESDPLFQQLDVVQRGAVVPIEPVPFVALRNPSVLTISFALDQLVPRLQEVNLGAAG